MDEEHKALRRSLTKAEGQLRKLELQMRMLNFRHYMLLQLQRPIGSPTRGMERRYHRRFPPR